MSGLRVAVIGGGIGGCAAALALQRAGCIVDVFEQVPVKGEVGAGIQISPNASRLLSAYGLAQRRWSRLVSGAAWSGNGARLRRALLSCSSRRSAWHHQRRDPAAPFAHGAAMCRPGAA